MQRFYNCVSPYVSGNLIYFTGQGAGTKCISVESQGGKYNIKEIWSNTAVGAKWNTPVLKDNFLYGFSDTRRIYCLNAANGQTAWLDETVNSDFATLVDCGSVLIGLPSTGNLIVFKPESGAYSEIIRYKVCDTPVYSYPLISGNNIYVKDAESLTLYAIN
jgi:outer membrane protein assembly factor BamB